MTSSGALNGRLRTIGKATTIQEAFTGLYLTHIFSLDRGKEAQYLFLPGVGSAVVEHIRGANRHGAGPVYTHDTDLLQPHSSLGTAVKIQRPFQRGRGQFDCEGARVGIVFKSIKGGPPTLLFLTFFLLSSTSPTSTHLSSISITFLCVHKAQHLLPLAHKL